MEGFTAIDAGVLGVLLVSGILAYSRGIVREALSIGGWLLAAVVAFSFAGDAEPLVAELPYLDQIIGDSCQLTILASFGIIFAVMLVLISLFTPMFSDAVQNSALGPLDRGAGFLFGLARGALLIAVALLVYQNTPVSSGGGIPMVEQAKTTVYFEDLTKRVEQEIPTETPPWIEKRFDQLVGNCS